MSVSINMLKVATGLAIGIAATASAHAQLAANGPVRVQVGNGPALIGSSKPSGSLGVSVLSSKPGTHFGTSVRLLGSDKTAGIHTKGADGKGTQLLTLKTPLESALAPITK